MRILITSLSIVVLIFVISAFYYSLYCRGIKERERRLFGINILFILVLFCTFLLSITFIFTADLLPQCADIYNYEKSLTRDNYLNNQLAMEEQVVIDTVNRDFLPRNKQFYYTYLFDKTSRYQKEIQDNYEDLENLQNTFYKELTSKLIKLEDTVVPKDTLKFNINKFIIDSTQHFICKTKMPLSLTLFIIALIIVSVITLVQSIILLTIQQSIKLTFISDKYLKVPLKTSAARRLVLIINLIVINLFLILYFYNYLFSFLRQDVYLSFKVYIGVFINSLVFISFNFCRYNED